MTFNKGYFFMNKKSASKKYHLWVLGCQMNESDGERIAKLMDNAGYKAADTADADLIIVVACSVRQKPIDRIWGRLRNWRKENPKAKIVLTGCLTSSDKQKFEKEFDLVFKIDNLTRLADFINHEVIISDYLDLKPKHEYADKAFVPIMTGCNNFCSYCVVPYTRGRERSRPINKIVEEVRCLVDKGYKKIVLLGQNVNSYQIDKNKSRASDDFVSLLRKIDSLEGKFEIEFLTSHPKDLSDELIKAIANLEKISSNLHLPVQSGSNRILKKMNRNYSRKDYLKLVAKLKKVVPDIILSTDIIVGFPGESREDFEDTIDLVSEVKFDKAYISKYSPRPGTKAEKLPDNVSLEEKKRRWKKLDNMINKKTS
jgi:tRNA-2-methylthio-N6-dimethylallyladenosine synthase